MPTTDSNEPISMLIIIEVCKFVLATSIGLFFSFWFGLNKIHPLITLWLIVASGVVIFIINVLFKNTRSKKNGRQ